MRYRTQYTETIEKMNFSTSTFLLSVLVPEVHALKKIYIGFFFFANVTTVVDNNTKNNMKN